jgi:hypothetical protein
MFLEHFIADVVEFGGGYARSDAFLHFLQGEADDFSDAQQFYKFLL